jgi:hypothetical protein
MSVYIDKKDGEVTAIHVHHEDVRLLHRTLELLIDFAQEHGLSATTLRNDPLNKALFLIMREF